MKKNDLSLGLAIIPLIFLVFLLSINVFIYGDNALNGSNQFILLLGGVIAAIIGFYKNIPYKTMIKKIAENNKEYSCFFSGYDSDSLALENVTNFLKEFIKYFEISPINKILPQVNKRVLWNPMITSVKIKLNKTKGKNFKPSKAGT